MNFRTEISPERIMSITQKDRIVSLGSCFSDNIGQRLEKQGFYTLNNPFGNIFHPTPIAELISRALHQKPFSIEEAQLINNRYYLWQAHGHLSDVSAEKLIEIANSKLTELRSELTNGKVLLITFGTAWGYLHLDTNLVVANCHKAHGNLFEKQCTSLETLTIQWHVLIQELFEFNQNLRVVFTVSPVRHWKDGAEGNSKSKAILRLLCDALQKRDNVFYFPAFELLTDDLRDYRFYADDLLHPTPFAINYVWEKFSCACLSQNAITLGTEVEKLHRFFAHRPIHSSNKDAFTDQAAKIERLKLEFPFLKFPQP